MKTRIKVFEEVALALGVALSHRELDSLESNGYSFAISLKNLPKPLGCEFRVRESLLSWTLELYLDNFPGELLATLKKGFAERKFEIFGLIEALREETNELLFLINDEKFDESYDSTIWESVELRLRYRFQEPNESEKTLRKALLGSLSILLELIMDQSEDFEVEISPGYEEGEKSKILRNHYERSRINRALCLEWHGFECKACGLNMESKYGPLGEGVIHVHHLQPVSLMELPRILNPKTDLIPLCPNCHVIIHRKNPPITIVELQNELRLIKKINFNENTNY